MRWQFAGLCIVLALFLAFLPAEAGTPDSSDGMPQNSAASGFPSKDTIYRNDPMMELRQSPSGHSLPLTLDLPNISGKKAFPYQQNPLTTELGSPDVQAVYKAMQRHARPELNAVTTTSSNNLQPGSTTNNTAFSTPTAAQDVSQKPGNKKFLQSSRLESSYRTQYDFSAANPLRQFGYDLFPNANLQSNTSVRIRPAPPADYRIGPGDILRLRLISPRQDRECIVQVGPDGQASIPGIDVVALAGLTHQQAVATIEERGNSYLPGLTARLQFEGLRDIRVYVVGEVHSPGLHTLPAYSTALEALQAAGGIRKTGSLRTITKRKAGSESTIDFYNLLLHGQGKVDLSLADLDVLFVPRIGKTAAVCGAVSSPAIYELKDETSVKDLLATAGGVLPHADTTRIHLRRFSNNDRFVISDLRDLSSTPLENIAIENGDLVTVGTLLSENPSVVTLEGHVWTPDTFRWRPGLQLSTILKGPQLLRPGAITDFALLYRYNETTTRTTVSTFPLSHVLEGSHDAPLSPHDRIVVLSRREFGISESVSIGGAVWKPGTFEFSANLTLVDLLALGGGLRIGSDPSRIELTRKILENGQTRTVHIPLNLDEDRRFPLQVGDSVLVLEIKDARGMPMAQIRGEVRYPGAYPIAAGERVSDLIRRAGGFTEHAYFHGARYTSEKARTVQQQSLDRLVEGLEIEASQVMATQAQTAASQEEAQGVEAARMYFERMFTRLSSIKASGRIIVTLTDLASFATSPHDFELSAGDALTIPRKPGFVSVMGSVYAPNSFLYKPGGTVLDYYERSGGGTRSSAPDNLYILQANGEVKARAIIGSRIMDHELMPGDTLVVPEDLERIPYFRLIKGVSDVLFKIATTAGIALAVL